ncbi:helix-turn-helix transcriptional regulator [Micromonospora aurantiaca (nom. illeg.)]|uniref:helix-turn-helix transcriptional regulator n=1 Tax=Micromonospora aurantiaca (nom. illeg.) TaxID=47850 RepID=UPI0033FC083A
MAHRLYEREARSRAGDGRPAQRSEEALRQATRRLNTLRIQYGSYERGAHQPRGPMLRDLAEILGVDVLDLLDPDAPRDLAVLRARLGMSQDDVAGELGLSRAGYAHIEQGRAALTDDIARRLAAVLKVEVRDLPQPELRAR